MSGERINMDLTKEEVEQITRQREQRERRRWICEGFFLAGDYLRGLGDQCAGGSGQETNPATGKPFGQPYYDMADAILQRGSYLSANPQEINA